MQSLTQQPKQCGSSFGIDTLLCSLCNFEFQVLFQSRSRNTVDKMIRGRLLQVSIISALSLFALLCSSLNLALQRPKISGTLSRNSRQHMHALLYYTRPPCVGAPASISATSSSVAGRQGHNLSSLHNQFSELHFSDPAAIKLDSAAHGPFMPAFVPPPPLGMHH